MGRPPAAGSASATTKNHGLPDIRPALCYSSCLRSVHRKLMEAQVKMDTSRRNFLAAGLALPAAGLATTTSSPSPSAPAPQPAAATPGKITYRVLGKTGMKVSTVGYGCMITSDPTVITRAADMGINYFDTSRNYQSAQNERMVGAALD